MCITCTGVWGGGVCVPRLQKCKACYKQLKNLGNIVRNRAEQVGRHGSTFKELQLLMVPLDV